MKINKSIPLMTIFLFVTIFTINDVFAEDSQTIEVEIKYTNGDRVDYNGMRLLVFQDFEKEPILEKTLTSNPDFISVEKNHRYKIEVYANGVYADVGYVQLENNPEKIDINIPLAGGILFEVYYEDGLTPIEDATVILKSSDNTEQRRGQTNDVGQTTRYWIQSTTNQDDYYIADIYLEDLFLKSLHPIKIQPGISDEQKIVTNIPEIVEELFSVNLFQGSKKITSYDGEYEVILTNLQGEEIISKDVNFRGDAQFSNLKSGTYVAKIATNFEKEDNLWPETIIHITGEVNKFNIFKNSEIIVEQQSPFYSCNCISFRLDDVQDYWLADTQVELINLFAEKNVPLTVGVIGSLIGEDKRITSVLEENIQSGNIEIANHSWNNDILTEQSTEKQNQYVLETNQKISEVFDVTPTSFIPPQNLYDQQTIEILKSNGFSYLSSHVNENNFASIDEDSFYIVPAITETAKLINNDTEWKLLEKEEILEKIIEGINQDGYVIIMMHPQEFALNEQGEYDIPNQSTIDELGLLLEEVKKLDSILVKISEITPFVEADIEPDAEPINDIEEISEAETCNCVAFRFDDIQDYWLNDVQIEVMKTFVDNSIPLTVGIIADAFGNDPKITEFVKADIENDQVLEIATKGTGLTSYTDYDKNQQNLDLKESINTIESVIGVKTNVLIPPNNNFNSDTFEILEENNITHISASIHTGDEPPFEFKDQTFYRFPQTTATGKYDASTNLFEGLTSKRTLDESIQSINNFGFAVISIHAQEFSTIENSTYTNSVNSEQLDELKRLIGELKKKQIKIVSIGEINSNFVPQVPSWIKNNAGWWADGSIDDETFVQGIEFLVKEGIITVSEESKTPSTERNVPSWIKNNAGWWADDSIDDETFVQGIEFLVKEGIITY